MHFGRNPTERCQGRDSPLYQYYKSLVVRAYKVIQDSTNAEKELENKTLLQTTRISSLNNSPEQFSLSRGYNGSSRKPSSTAVSSCNSHTTDTIDLTQDSNSRMLLVEAFFMQSRDWSYELITSQAWCDIALVCITDEWSMIRKKAIAEYTALLNDNYSLYTQHLHEKETWMTGLQKQIEFESIPRWRRRNKDIDNTSVFSGSVCDSPYSKSNQEDCASLRSVSPCSFNIPFAAPLSPARGANTPNHISLSQSMNNCKTPDKNDTDLTLKNLSYLSVSSCSRSISYKEFENSITKPTRGSTPGSPKEALLIELERVKKIQLPTLLPFPFSELLQIVKGGSPTFNANTHLYKPKWYILDGILQFLLSCFKTPEIRHRILSGDGHVILSFGQITAKNDPNNSRRNRALGNLSSPVIKRSASWNNSLSPKVVRSTSKTSNERHRSISEINRTLVPPSSLNKSPKKNPKVEAFYNVAFVIIQTICLPNVKHLQIPVRTAAAELAFFIATSCYPTDDVLREMTSFIQGHGVSLIRNALDVRKDPSPIFSMTLASNTMNSFCSSNGFSRNRGSINSTLCESEKLLPSTPRPLARRSSSKQSTIRSPSETYRNSLSRIGVNNNNTMKLGATYSSPQTPRATLRTPEPVINPAQLKAEELASIEGGLLLLRHLPKDEGVNLLNSQSTLITIASGYPAATVRFSVSELLHYWTLYELMNSKWFSDLDKFVDEVLQNKTLDKIEASSEKMFGGPLSSYECTMFTCSAASMTSHLSDSISYQDRCAFRIETLLVAAIEDLKRDVKKIILLPGESSKQEKMELADSCEKLILFLSKITHLSNPFEDCIEVLRVVKQITPLAVQGWILAEDRIQVGTSLLCAKIREAVSKSLIVARSFAWFSALKYGIDLACFNVQSKYSLNVSPSRLKKRQNKAMSGAYFWIKTMGESGILGDCFVKIFLNSYGASEYLDSLVTLEPSDSCIDIIAIPFPDESDWTEALNCNPDQAAKHSIAYSRAAFQRQGRITILENVICNCWLPYISRVDCMSHIQCLVLDAILVALKGGKWPVVYESISSSYIHNYHPFDFLANPDFNEPSLEEGGKDLSDGVLWIEQNIRTALAESGVMNNKHHKNRNHQDNISEVCCPLADEIVNAITMATNNLVIDKGTDPTVLKHIEVISLNLFQHSSGTKKVVAGRIMLAYIKRIRLIFPDFKTNFTGNSTSDQIEEDDDEDDWDSLANICRNGEVEGITLNEEVLRTRRIALKTFQSAGMFEMVLLAGVISGIKKRDVPEFIDDFKFFQAIP